MSLVLSCPSLIPWFAGWTNRISFTSENRRVGDNCCLLSMTFFGAPFHLLVEGVINQNGLQNGSVKKIMITLNKFPSIA